MREKVDDLRRKREELPAPHLSQAAAAEEIERQAQADVLRMENERDEQLSILDKLIEKAGEISAAAKEAIERKADKLFSLMARVDAFDRKVDAELARKKEAEILRGIPLPLNKEIDYDPRSRSISRGGREL